jgi:hypothetical protein
VALSLAVVAGRGLGARLDCAAMVLFVSALAALLRLTVLSFFLTAHGSHVVAKRLAPVATLDS